MKTTVKILTLMAIATIALLTSCEKTEPIVPLNALMGGKWVYEEEDHTDGSFTTHQEVLTFTSETECKREEIWKTLFQNTCDAYDLTYTFDGEWGELTGILFYFGKVKTLPFQYDSINQTLTVWTDHLFNRITKHFTYYRKK